MEPGGQDSSGSEDPRKHLEKCTFLAAFFLRPWVKTSCFESLLSIRRSDFGEIAEAQSWSCQHMKAELDSNFLLQS